MKKRLLNLFIALFASVTAFAQGYNVEVCVNITGPQPNAPIVATLTYYSGGVANTVTQTVANVVLPYTLCFPAYLQTPDSGFFAYAAGSISLSTCPPAQSYNYSQMISGNTTITVNAQNCNSGGSNTTCGVGAQAYADSLNSNLVYFNAYPTGTAPYTYAWVFSDGSTSTLQNPSVTFTNGGLNWGNVTVTDANGCVSSYTASIQNTPPSMTCYSSISYQANYSNGNAGEVFFNGYVGNSSPMNASYSWDFGDGSTSSLSNPQHTYATSGYYYVCLTTAYNGCTYTSCTSVYVDLTWWNVGPPFQGPCSAGFMIMAGGPANSTGLITIVNTSQGNNLNYTWSFGNGFVSNNATPFTTIVNSGVYEICLSISDSTGTCNDTFCDTITVDSAGNVTRAVLPGNIGIVVVGAPQPSTVTAINSIQNNAVLAITPNPSNGFVTINTESFIGTTNVELFDLSGKSVYSKNIMVGKGLKNTTLDLQNLANGNYLIKVVSENHVQTGKIIINH
ncbi:MAG TPA: PKD domain-containing protein [Bacteroidia bacterium]|nr:PKD domain-containing protein [Bacteroidia bacterium]